MFRDYEEARDWAERSLIELLKSMEDYEIIDLMIEAGAYPEIMPMSAFDEYFDDMTPSELMSSVAYGFNTSDDWFYMNKSDLYESFSSLADVPDLKIDYDDIADDILSTMDSYGNDAVQEVLDQISD